MAKGSAALVKNLGVEQCDDPKEEGHQHLMYPKAKREENAKIVRVLESEAWSHAMITP
jgi:hypothetical protein